MSYELRAEALAHAIKQMPREACGVVVIARGRERFVPCRNVSPYQDMFEIHPEDLAAAEDMGDVVRIFHSHCYTPAMPSEVDQVSCDHSGLPWSIVSVPNGTWCHFEPKGYKAPLVGRQWCHGLLDCYALIRDYYRQTLNVELLDFERDDQWWLKGGNLYLEKFPEAGFRLVPIKDAKPHDLLLMQLNSPVINHGAVYLGDDMMLHHMHRRLSCRDVWGGFYKRSTLKVLRHETQ